MPDDDLHINQNRTSLLALKRLVEQLKSRGKPTGLEEHTGWIVNPKGDVIQILCRLEEDSRRVRSIIVGKRKDKSKHLESQSNSMSTNRH